MQSDLKPPILSLSSTPGYDHGIADVLLEAHIVRKEPSTATVAAILGIVALTGVAMSIVSKLIFVSTIFLGPLFLLPFAFMFFTIMFPIAFGGIMLYGTTGHGVIPGWFMWAVAGGVVYQVWQRLRKGDKIEKSKEDDVAVEVESSQWDEEVGRRIVNDMKGFDERLKEKTGEGLGGIGEVGGWVRDTARQRTSKKKNNASSWSVDEVGNMLRREGFGAYARAFMAEKIDGSVLVELTEDDLYEIDGKYVPLGDRKRLAAYVKELRETRNR